jgi:transposase
MKTKTTQKFPIEFKMEALKLVTEEGNTQAKADRALGINGKNSSRWLKELSGNFPAKHHELEAQQQELVRLSKESLCLKMERDILKNRLKATLCPEWQKLPDAEDMLNVSKEVAVSFLVV